MGRRKKILTEDLYVRLAVWPDEGLRREFIEGYPDFLSTYGKKRTLDPIETGDLITKTVMAILDRAAEYRPSETPLWVWVRGFARLIALGILRERRRHAAVSLTEEIVADDSRTADEALYQSLKQFAVKSLTQSRLSAKTVLLGAPVVLGDEKVATIAEMYCEDEQTVHVAVHRVRAHLRVSIPSAREFSDEDALNRYRQPNTGKIGDSMDSDKSP